MLKTGLSTSLKLETRIDPALILRSELLELPLLQLDNRIQLELSTNPFLLTEAEIEEEIVEQEEVETPEEKEKEEEIDWEEYVQDFSNYEDNYPVMYDKDREEIEFQPPIEKTLEDSLLEQIQNGNFSPLEQEIASEIIGNLDKDGYLACPFYDITKNFSDVEEYVVEETLLKVQKLDPVGVAARDIKECLIVQLTSRELYIEDSYIVLRDYYQDFVNKRYKKIMKKTGINEEQMQEVIEEITSLNPRPGISRHISLWEKADQLSEKRDAITPDFYVREIDGELEVLVNDSTIPNLSINQNYSNLILSNTAEKTAKDFVKKKLESARWFINAIMQRKQTLRKVMRSIIKFQEEFFFEGPSKIKPLILKDVAEDIEMDVTTVSRCTKEKYVDTDYGIFELKYFFTDKLSTTSGEIVSTTIVKDRVKSMIENEDKKKPLSDQKISELLKEEGHTAARRTVQKYREQLQIPVARLRKDIF
ncbi:MAG: RNA polymerase sigma-54 factor [Candidatus Cloacimonadota bacterium]|nr:MAG: RNA polymerase sigma-54 factor [Candidatus Cloacimonadota bacterium]PIE80535.1 MAG: RNA polymerase sigma-54 factor [Candidatus Delongbacteria bacterium]